MNIIDKNVIETPNSKSSNVVLLDTAGTDLATSYPNGVYALLTYPAGGINASINADNLSSIEMNTDDLETLLGSIENNTDDLETLLGSIEDNTDQLDGNTSYQDTPLNAQKSVTTSATQITTTAKKGWITLTVNSGDTVYIGDSGVTTGNGYRLNDDNPSVTVSSDNLSEWYVIGDAGAETLFVIGAYIA